MDSRHSALAAQREKGDRSDACGTAPAATKRAKQALMDATQHLSANNPEAAAACFAQFVPHTLSFPPQFTSKR